MAPSVTAIFDDFSEALLVSPRILTSELNIVLKGMPRIMNFNNGQWVKNNW